jgi:hypothetical protein
MAETPQVPDDRIGWALAQLQARARGGAVIYNIAYRPAGVGIEWHEPARQGDSFDFNTGLHCYGFHPTLGHALGAEMVRLVQEVQAAGTPARQAAEGVLKGMRKSGPV